MNHKNGSEDKILLRIKVLYTESNVEIIAHRSYSHSMIPESLDVDYATNRYLQVII